MKKRWYGRPNKPPENWHTPEKPAIRVISGWRDEDMSIPSHPSQAEGGNITVTFQVDDWVMILKTLQLYDASNDDVQWCEWRGQVRKQILGTINPHINRPQHSVDVGLALEDWRQIWQVVRAICDSREDGWQQWFTRISNAMTKQIKEQV